MSASRKNGIHFQILIINLFFWLVFRFFRVFRAMLASFFTAFGFTAKFLFGRILTHIAALVSLGLIQKEGFSLFTFSRNGFFVGSKRHLDSFWGFEMISEHSLTN